MPTLWHSGPSSRYLPAPAARPLHKLRRSGTCCYSWRPHGTPVHSELPPLRRWPQEWSSRLCWTVPAAGQVGIPTRIHAEDNGGGGGTNRLRLPRLAPRKHQPPSRISQNRASAGSRGRGRG
ncbi:hypothetical protein HPB51_002993 [Rhipicephalus microplus]|uniref:Uncharacterized protein n=1 Tax=Rhipicephalus microplus TaxID=6941 RepID=A0A9J6DS83_RHIMP|nr:hypothetical protein HPB51_002993 [Rhipicephalus microplus]